MSTEGNLWTDTFVIEDMSFLEKEHKNIKFFEEIYEVNRHKNNEILNYLENGKDNFTEINRFSFESVMKKYQKQR